MEFPVGSWIVSRSYYSFGIARVVKETPQKLGIDSSYNLHGQSVFKDHVFFVAATREEVEQVLNDLKAERARYDAALRALSEEHKEAIKSIRIAALSRATGA